ncbi:Glycosyltransferase, GT2 family [Massilia sp. PDC64]|nr:glycosyltransferase [Massilia sp. PDC64]SDD14095.1 Glycosyltransferase, GT2 family [Massilia sp. PDC64]
MHTPTVTVIALCYNHERFLLDCLESIRAQTFQDFELIVTDDCSRDHSPHIIAEWLAEHYPAARFIRHDVNRGICATLNEALAQAQGTYISMTATDDTWMPHKLASQVALAQSLDADTAVIYADADQMNEEGELLPTRFIEAHGVTDPPQGWVFSRLANGNFIPAMTTLIRRDALLAVGGYDERLNYEDYDMWLRLADRYAFAFQPDVVAHYRIVATSMVRTVFAQPSAWYHHSNFLIRRKWLRSGRLTRAQCAMWADKMWWAAYGLFVLNDRRAASCLWEAFRHCGRPRAAVLALTSRLGVSRARLVRLRQAVTGMTRDTPT